MQRGVGNGRIAEREAVAGPAQRTWRTGIATGRSAADSRVGRAAAEKREQARRKGEHVDQLVQDEGFEIGIACGVGLQRIGTHVNRTGDRTVVLVAAADGGRCNGTDTAR